MNIEIGKHYIIEASFKKRVTEVEFYKKNDETILFDTLWRNGEFRIEPTLQGECDYIQKFIDLDKDSHDEFDLNVFVSMEMEGTFDGCSTYFRGNITKDLQDQIYESDLSVHEYLTEELKYEHTDTEYYINGPIDVREVEKRKW
tara:strand:- start:18 stop:449 length:432 start_codon:yes stop_codon:yes gene_type:complete